MLCACAVISSLSIPISGRNTGNVATLPLFRPLIGMDKDEIMAQAQTLGSYPISIIPDQDCCTLFTPRNPATRARFDEVEAAESGLAVDEFVESAVRAAELEDFAFPTVSPMVGSTHEP